MKPVTKDGRPIYPSVFRKLVAIGEKLEEFGWKESRNKPNLFYKEFDDVFVFADMRGTDIVPIWDEPYPLIYARQDHPDWKRRRAISLATNELTTADIEYRFSFYDQMEPGGLLFGDEKMLPNGMCKMCGELLLGEDLESKLFCSEHCETSFAQLTELRREEGYHNIKCALCGKPLGRWDEDAISHHIQYEPEEKTIWVCRSCHMKIHSNSEKYPELAPKRPPDWKY